jgi:N utilization substance protein B
MSARSKARKRALDMLYVAEVRELPIADVLATETVRHLDQPERASSWDYARQIVTGIDEARYEIDDVITDHAQGWAIARMPVLDRCILRMGVWELRFNPEVPDAVAIAEAVELAQSLSTEDSAGFVNGVLGAVAERRGPSGRTVAEDQESR